MGIKVKSYQEIASKTIDSLMSNYQSKIASKEAINTSCTLMCWASRTRFVPGEDKEAISYYILDEYRTHSRARKQYAGFEDISHSDWLNLSDKEQYDIRLERLYSFWYANFNMDGME